MAYGELYRLEYRDQLIEGQKGRLTTVKILRKDYTGSWSYVKGAGNPVMISAKTDGDYLFDQIVASSCKINLMSEVSFQFLDIFSADIRQHKVEVWKEPETDATQELFWTGFVLPDNYSEPIHYDKNYIVTIEAVDGLAQLKDIDFLDNNGNKYEVNFFLIDLFFEILKKTGLELSHAYAPAYTEIYALSNPGWECIFSKILVKSITFYQNGIPKCDYVLKQVLQAFGCRIIQHKGVWTIKECTKNIGEHTVYTIAETAPYEYVVGTYNHSPVKAYTGKDDRTVNRLFFVNKEGDMQINPAYKYLDITHNLLIRNSFIDNNNFEYNYPTGRIFEGSGGGFPQYYPDNWTIVDTSPNKTYIGLCPDFFEFYASQGYPSKLNTLVIKSYSDSDSDFVRTDWIKLEGEGIPRFVVLDISIDYWTKRAGTILSFRVELTNFSGLNYYLDSNGVWQTSVVNYQHGDDNFDTPDMEDYATFQVRTDDNLTYSGDLYFRISLFAYSTEATWISEVRIVPIIRENLIIKENNFHVDISPNNIFIPEKIESILGDVPDIRDKANTYYGTFWRYDEYANLIPTKQWRNESNNETTILQLLAESITDTHYAPKQYLTGLRMRGNFDFDSSLQVSFLDNRIYLPIHYEYYDKYCEWVIDCVEVLADRVLGTETENNFIVTESTIPEDDENLILL